MQGTRIEKGASDKTFEVSSFYFQFTEYVTNWYISMLLSEFI